MNEVPTGMRARRSRRWVLGASVAAAAAAPTVWIADSALAEDTRLASVDHEMVLVAAQVDPRKSGTGTTPGAKDHVLRVEQGLDAKGLLASSRVDGHYGTTTVSAYSAWQRELGYSGLDANGMPGKTSLTKLGEGRFSVTRAVSVGSNSDSYGGERVNSRTRAMLAAADAKLPFSIRLTQGSYTDANPGSAGTHAGGGAVDISVSGLSSSQRWRMVKALRTVGFAAWLRTPSQGFAYHIHGMAVADPDLSETAQPQIHDYYFGKNGLASHGPDNTPSEYRVNFTWWEKYKRG